MSGVKGRSGRSRLSPEELKLRGTFQRVRHLTTIATVDPNIQIRKWKRFLKQLATAKAKPGWTPLDAYAEGLRGHGAGGQVSPARL